MADKVKKLSDLIPQLPGVEKATAQKVVTPVRALKTPEINEYILDDVKKSQNLIDAEKQLAIHQQIKPGAYQSQFTDQLNAITDSILNREPFTYDFNADPIYQQYKDQYTALGDMAMRDTMGNAAALTGGYGNSYASTAGNQAYQAYLQQLNNIIPELQQNAYARDQDELAALYQQAGLLQGLEDAAYNKWSDERADWYNLLNYYTDTANDLYDREYGEALTEREWDYALQQDALKGSGGGGGYYTEPEEEKPLIPQVSFGALDSQVENAMRLGWGQAAYDMITSAVVSGSITETQAESLFEKYYINPEKYHQELYG